MRRTINLGLICAFIFGIALAASPQWHDRIHTSAQHECAVTLIASGNYEHSAPPALVVRPITLEQFDIVNSKPVFVPPLFLSACILEHAPPQNS